VSEKDFADAIREFEEAVGLDWVFTSDEDLDLYRDAYSPYKGEPREMMASAAVAPDNVEEVSKVVKIANAYKIPIYTISTGRGLGYGHCAPVYSGSVILELKRMNRIIEVNEKNAYCLVEPGVNYFDLYRYTEEKGLRLMDSIAENCFGGLVGNSLDHGNGFLPPEYRDHFGAHCGMEVVTANGDIMRTGMGALPNSKIWQQYKYGLGPYIDGIFSQGNMGVVTKMGFWMYPMPEAHFEGTVYVPRHDDLIRLVEIQNYLMHSSVATGFSSLGAPLFRRGPGGPAGQGQKQDPELAALLAKLDVRDISPEFEKYALRKGVPYWSAGLTFFGPLRVVKAQWEYAKEKFSAIPGATFEDGRLVRFPLTREYIETQGALARVAQFGVPNLQNFGISTRGRMNATPPLGHVFCAPLLPRTGQDLLEFNKVFAQFGAETGSTRFGPSMFQMPMDFLGPRTFMTVWSMSIVADVETNKKSREEYRAVVKVLGEHGWGEYRSHPVFYNDIMDDYSYNNHALMHLHETIKDAVDPNGILSAGRYGIWPKHLRHMKEVKSS